MRLKNVLLGSLACLWGPSFLFIKIALVEIPPITLVLGRIGIAALVLYLLLKLQGYALPRWGMVWQHIAVAGLLHNALPFVLIVWGEKYITSALASILNGTMPFFTVILAHLFIAEERLTPLKIVGVLIGFSGLVVLTAPTLLAGGLQATTWGVLAVVLASASYGAAAVYERKFLRGIWPALVTTGQLGLAALYLLPLALWFERPYLLPMPSWKPMGAVLFLAIFGTAIAFVIYYYALERTDASTVSMVTYLIPVVGVFLGVVVLGEEVTWYTYLGSVLILLGVMTVNGVFKFRWHRKI